MKACSTGHPASALKDQVEENPPKVVRLTRDTTTRRTEREQSARECSGRGCIRCCVVGSII